MARARHGAPGVRLFWMSFCRRVARFYLFAGAVFVPPGFGLPHRGRRFYRKRPLCAFFLPAFPFFDGSLPAAHPPLTFYKIKNAKRSETI